MFYFANSFAEIGLKINKRNIFEQVYRNFKLRYAGNMNIHAYKIDKIK